MTCTLDHTPDGWVPDFLCRHCHPELATRAVAAAPIPEGIALEVDEEAHRKRKLRRARAEVRGWRERLEELQKRPDKVDPRLIEKVEKALREAECEMYLLA